MIKKIKLCAKGLYSSSRIYTYDKYDDTRKQAQPQVESQTELSEVFVDEIHCC